MLKYYQDQFTESIVLAVVKEYKRINCYTRGCIANNNVILVI